MKNAVSRSLAVVALVGIALLSGCAQMNAKKLGPELEARIAESSDKYLACAAAYAKKYGPVADSAVIVAEGANSECYYLMEDVRDAMQELAATRYMSKSYQDKLVKEKVAELEERARRATIDAVVKAKLGEF